MPDQLLPYRILLVEDEEGIRKNYAAYLSRQFEYVYTAADGAEGLVSYRKNKPDIMIIDIELPKLGGLQLLSTIRESDHTTRAIMLTAYTDKQMLIEAAELMLTRYLVKPIARDALRQALQKAIDEINQYKVISQKCLELYDGYKWVYENQKLLHHHKTVKLTSHQKLIMQTLCNHGGETVTVEELMQAIWNDSDEKYINTLKSSISLLRKKLPKDLIVSEYGSGYRLNFD